MVSVLQITDTHLFADPAGELYGVNTRASLRAVLNHKNATGVKSDLLILTGDLSHDESEQSYAALGEYVEPLNIPVYCLPGNHDASVLLEKRFENATNEGIAHAVHGVWLIILMDSSIPGAVEGMVAPKVLAQLETLLKQYREKHVLVAVHHNPVKVGSAWMDRIGLQNGDELFAKLGKYDTVKAVICGHIHQELETRVNNIAVYGTPSSCFQFMPHTPEAEIDDKPPGYRVLLLYDDGTVQSQVHWVGEQ